MFKIFITETSLKHVIDSEAAKPVTKRSPLFKLLQGQKKVYVSTTDKTWMQDVCHKYQINIDPSQSKYIASLATNPEEVLKNPSSLFILNISITEAENIRKSYGVFCLSKDSLNIYPLIDTNDEHTTDDREPLGQGWSTVLQSLRDMPSNALVLNDRYLFANDNDRIGDGIPNVQSILDALLPQRFLDTYHVTIIFDVEAIYQKFDFRYITASLNFIRQELNRDYPIDMELIGISKDCPVYEKLHNRRIVSNYYIVKAEHKLAAFNGNVATASQSIIPQVLFTLDSLNKHSSPPLKSIDQILDVLRSFSQWTLRTTDHTLYRYALNDRIQPRCTGIKNRIIK